MESNDNARTGAPGGGGTGAYWMAVGGLVLLVGIVGFALLRRQGPAPASSEPAGKEGPGRAGPTMIKADVPGLLSPEARIMTERFRCVCGCGDRLSVCTCENTPGARDMKAYVAELVTAVRSISDIDRAMVERYGEAVMFDRPETEPDAKSR